MRPSNLVLHRLLRRYRSARGCLRSQRDVLRNDVLAVKGLMPLLMKGRNEGGWSKSDREELRARLKRLSAASPFVVVLMMPGGLLLLPILAWWLDRRSRRRDGSAEAIEHPSR
jgi:hypothetical protein